MCFLTAMKQWFEWTWLLNAPGRTLMGTASAWRAESPGGPAVTGWGEVGSLEKVTLGLQPFRVTPEHERDCEKSQIQSSQFLIRSLNSGKFLDT